MCPTVITHVHNVIAANVDHRWSTIQSAIFPKYFNTGVGIRFAILREQSVRCVEERFRDVAAPDRFFFDFRYIDSAITVSVQSSEQEDLGCVR